MKSATATSQASVPTSHQAKWAWPIRVDAYDRSADLTQVEQQQLSSLLSCPGRLWRWTAALRQNLDRLIRPVSDVMGVTGADLETRRILLRVLLLETARRQKTFWAWTTDEWAETLVLPTLFLRNAIVKQGRAFGIADPTSSLSATWAGVSRTRGLLAAFTLSFWLRRFSDKSE